MLNSIIKSNSVIVSYEMLSEEGVLTKKRQTFNLVSFSATNEDFYAIGSAVGNMLASGAKEIIKSNQTLLVEE